MSLTSPENPAHQRERTPQDHQWLQFTRMVRPPGDPMPVITRGDGCYVWDSEGNRYLDGLAGLFVTQVGHGRREIAEAMAEQATTLAYFPLWGHMHPAATELADKLATLTPPGLNRVFFTTGGSEAVESAVKLARQYFKAVGEPLRTKFLSRYLSYHGTTFGALSVTGLPEIKSTFEPLLPGGVRVENTNIYRAPEYARDPDTFVGWAAGDIERRILMEGPETVAAVFIEPVQNSGGCFVAPPAYFAKVREICDRYGVLMVSDEVICGFGRLGDWFGASLYDYVPDIMTVAKGLASGYAPIGAMVAHERLIEPFLVEGASFLHGHTFAGHPVACRAALTNLEIFEREGLIDHVRASSPEFRRQLESLYSAPMVGDVRGEGYFFGIELVKDVETREPFSDDECEWLLRSCLSPSLYGQGLICRVDDRGDAVIQLSPPLTSGPEQFAEIVATLRVALEGAWSEYQRR